MPAPVVAVGGLPALADVGRWFLTAALSVASDRLRPLLADPVGSAQRLGDLIVWDGAGGRHVIGLLAGVSESQARIEGAVGRIEAAQIGIAGTLDSLVNLSLFHLGAGALAATFLLARLKALNDRLAALSQQLTDIQDHLTARDKAALGNGLVHLDRFEKKREEPDLRLAFAQCNEARLLYQNLVSNELGGPRRLAVLNQCGRCYLLALLATVRCRLLHGDIEEVDPLITSERPTMTALAATTFDLVLGKSPEVYLEPGMEAEAVTLARLAEVYRQARLAGADDGIPVSDAGGLFERLRGRVFGAGRSGVWFGGAGKIRTQLAVRLRYLVAALEDVNRVEAVRLRVVEARAGGYDPDTVDQLVEAMKPDGPTAFAFTRPPHPTGRPS